MLPSPTPWHHAPAARAILAGLTPADLCIALERPIPGPDHFRFAPLSEKACRACERLEALRRAAVDALAGFSFASTAEPYDAGARARWLDTAQALPTLEDALSERFGDPHALWGRGKAGANAIWRHDPGYLLRAADEGEGRAGEGRAVA